MSSLKIIATPIGNLNDVSQNLIETVNTLDYILCEDTRVTAKFLKLINITKQIKLVSYHKYNETEKLDDVLILIKTKVCGMMSDAGYPGISDPGHTLIKACHACQIKIDVIDGPCAVNHAIVQSGMCENGYLFIGFLPRKSSELTQTLNKYLNLSLPVVCFESVHRINATLNWLKINYLGLHIYVGRELSKKFETYYIGNIIDVPEQIEKGEFCLVLNQIQTNSSQDVSFSALFDELKALLSVNIKLKDACKYLANKFEVSATDLYNQYQLNIK